jgi:ketosteroid isomerase-like protein
MLFFDESFPVIRAEVTNAFATEDQVTLEGIVRGTNTSSRNLPTGAIPATGRGIELRMCHVFQIRNGKIVSFHTYYDMTTLLELFGLAPATGQAT